MPHHLFEHHHDWRLQPCLSLPPVPKCSHAFRNQLQTCGIAFEDIWFLREEVAQISVKMDGVWLFMMVLQGCTNHHHIFIPSCPRSCNAHYHWWEKFTSPQVGLLPARRGWFVFGPSWMRERNTWIKLFSTLICQIQDGGICPFGTATGWKNIDTLSSHTTRMSHGN